MHGTLTVSYAQYISLSLVIHKKLWKMNVFTAFSRTQSLAELNRKKRVGFIVFFTS